MKKILFITFSLLFVCLSFTKNNNEIEYYKPINKMHWQAIIAFTDTDDVTEDWNWFFGDIIEACKKHSIFVSHSEVNNNYVDVGPIDKPTFRIDISKYRKKYPVRYLFLEKGKETKYVEYDMSDQTLLKASEYFKLNLSE